MFAEVIESWIQDSIVDAMDEPMYTVSLRTVSPKVKRDIAYRCMIDTDAQQEEDERLRTRSVRDTMPSVEAIERKNRQSYRAVAEKSAGRLLGAHDNVHHIDGNRLNNAPDNLLIVTRQGHSDVHSALKMLYKTLIELGHMTYVDGAYIYNPQPIDKPITVTAFKKGQIV